MTDFTTVRSSSSLMARSAASARSSMLMAWIIAIPAQQIFTFGTHQLHAGRPSSACGTTKARRHHDEEDSHDDTNDSAGDDGVPDGRRDRGGGPRQRARARPGSWRHARGHDEA